MLDILEALTQWEDAAYRYYAVDEDAPEVRLYSVNTRTLEMYPIEVTMEMLCDRLNTPQEEKHHIDFGMNRQYFPSLEAANDFIASRKK